MSKMFIRVPHYVAAYYRNKNKNKVISETEPVNLENEPKLWDMLECGIANNAYEELVKEGCFCERMWRKMMRGQSLVADENGKYAKVKRDLKAPLTIAEINSLCGWKCSAKQESSDEYLCVELPSVIYRYHQQIAVDGSYQLKGRMAQMFVAEMRRCFWNACMEYMDDYISAGRKNGHNRSKIEGLERFMLRYNIRSGNDNREMTALKRSYYRQMIRRDYVRYDYEEFGEL